MIVICTMLIGIHFFPITTIVRFFYRYSHIIECWYLMFLSLINIYLEFMFLTCAANDGFICCFSLQKLSKWFTTNGGCSSASLVCIAWYIYSPFDWFYCIFEVRGTFFFFPWSWAGLLVTIDMQVLLMSQKINFLISCASSRFVAIIIMWHTRISTPIFNVLQPLLTNKLFVMTL